MCVWIVQFVQLSQLAFGPSWRSVLVPSTTPLSRSSSSSHPASLPAFRPSDLCVHHTSCLSVDSVAWPRRLYRIACLQAYVPAFRSNLHCTALSPTHTFTLHTHPSRLPCAHIHCTHTLASLASHTTSVQLHHTIDHHHTHIHTHTKVVSSVNLPGLY